MLLEVYETNGFSSSGMGEKVYLCTFTRFRTRKSKLPVLPFEPADCEAVDVQRRCRLAFQGTILFLVAVYVIKSGPTVSYR